MAATPPARATCKTALKAAQLADAVIYAVVVLPITNDAGRNTGGEHALRIHGAGHRRTDLYPGDRTRNSTRRSPTSSANCARNTCWASTRSDVPLTKNPFHKLEVRVKSAGFAGLGAQRLLWGGRRAAAGIAGARISVTPGTSHQKKQLGELSTPQQGKSARAPEQTFEEAKYLKQLIENATRVRVKMEDGEEVAGIIEYYDQSFIRLTRDGEPNLFIFKHDIKYIQEES